MNYVKKEETLYIRASDGRFYNVNVGENEQKKSEVLSDMRKKLMALIKYCLEENFEKAKRLKNWSGIIEETIPEYDNHAAYSVNKGDRIGVCLTKKDGSFEQSNRILFVLMHELAHVMSRSYDHTDEFWDSYEFIVKVAVEKGLYTYENFDDNPVKFCGHNITYTPLKTN